MKSESPSSVYQINKGINASIEFKGLKAQYIWYMGGAAVLLFFIYAALYLIGLKSYWGIGIIALLAVPTFIGIYHLSNKYGEYGLIKILASKRMPKSIQVKSHAIFKSH